MEILTLDISGQMCKDDDDDASDGARAVMALMLIHLRLV